MPDETLVDERITVWVFFDSSILPIAMNWRSRLIKFQKVIFISTKRIGETRLINLICQGTSANFELEYNTANYLWKLKKIIPLE